MKKKYDGALGRQRQWSGPDWRREHNAESANLVNFEAMDSMLDFTGVMFLAAEYDVPEPLDRAALLELVIRLARDHVPYFQFDGKPSHRPPDTLASVRFVGEVEILRRELGSYQKAFEWKGAGRHGKDPEGAVRTSYRGHLKTLEKLFEGSWNREKIREYCARSAAADAVLAREGK